MTPRIAPLMILAAVAGCDPASTNGADDNATPSTGPIDVAPSGPDFECGEATTDERGCVRGQVTADDGRALAGLNVAVCSPSECAAVQTGGDGVFVVEDVEVGPVRVLVSGTPQGFTSALAYVSLPAPGPVEVPRPIAVLNRDADSGALPRHAGGSVALAGGTLELTAAPGALVYPAGTELDAERLSALPTPIALLPPSDIEPWVGKETSSRAFTFSPFYVRADPPVDIVLRNMVGLSAGTYRVYTAHPSAGTLETVGGATSDGAGTVILDPSAEVRHLTTLIFVLR